MEDHSRTKLEDIYVYASYGIKDVDEMFWQFAQKCGYSVLTCKKAVWEECRRENIHVVLLPSDPFRFRLALKKIKIAFIVLAGDNYYGDRNYLARQYPCAYIQGISWKGMPCWNKRIHQKEDPFYLKLHHCLGLTAKAFGKEWLMYDRSLRATCRAFADKLSWGLKNETLMHGSFSDLIFLQKEWEEEIWLKNGISEERIRTVGVIRADWIVDNLLDSSKRLRDDVESSDVLFFSQPLYQFAGTPRYLEELGMAVKECEKTGLKMVIKLHPRDDLKVYKKFESDCCRIVEHYKGWRDSDNLALINKTKVVMAKGSSSMIVPLLFGKPVMYLDLFDSDIVHLKYFLTLKLLLNKIEDFQALFAFAADPNNQEAIKQHQQEILDKAGYFDGQCWKRIKAEIEKFVEESRAQRK